MTPLHILIVDDDEETAELRTMVLGAAGHRVEYISSSPKALERIEKNPPGLVIVDIMMPEMDGRPRAHPSHPAECDPRGR